MCNCDLDSVNFFCWEHGIDITDGDYIEGCCGVCVEEFDDDDYEDEEDCFYPDDSQPGDSAPNAGAHAPKQKGGFEK